MIDDSQTTCEVETRFLSWFRQSGGRLDERCRLQPVEGMGRGMVAMQNIKAGETLFVIPRTALLNLSTSSLAQRCQDDEKGHVVEPQSSWAEISKSGWVPLILAMMFERRRAYVDRSQTDQGDVSMEDADAATLRAEQKWGPYFDIMPTEFSTPMFWSTEELEHLRGTSIVDKIARDEAGRDYADRALPCILSHREIFLSGVPTDNVEQEIARWYSLEMYHVMGSRVLSRSFHVKARQRSLDGKAVELNDADEGDHSDVEVLEEEAEGDGTGQEQSTEDIASEPETTTDTGDGANGAGDAEENEDSESDSGSDDDEDEQENVADISMTPMADMLNARFESDNARLFYKTQVLEMRATKDIAKGHQIFNTYANPPNSDLLRRYGHVDEPNGNDVVEMDAKYVVESAANALTGKLGLRAEEVQTDLAERLEWACSALGIDEVLILNYLFVPAAKAPHRPQPERPTARELKQAATGGEISEEMIALARIMCMSRESFEKAKSKGKGPSARLESQEQHSTKNGQTLRLSAAQTLIDAIDLRLRAYGDDPKIKAKSLAEAEESLLYGSKRCEVQCLNHRKALVVRLGEKRVLLDQRRVLQFVVDRLTEAAIDANSNGATAEKRKATAKSAKPQKKAR